MKKIVVTMVALAAILTGVVAVNGCSAQITEYKEIGMANPDGQIIKLSETIKANKYTLLDFWASWCPPCMAEVPYLTGAYEKYHEKGFEIFGVSYDKTAEAWTTAIKDKNMNWIHVSALAGWNCPTKSEYGVRSIPTNYLFDANGKVVATNLRGEALGAKLSELMK